MRTPAPSVVGMPDVIVVTSRRIVVNVIDQVLTNYWGWWRSGLRIIGPRDHSKAKLPLKYYAGEKGDATTAPQEPPAMASRHNPSYANNIEAPLTSSTLVEGFYILNQRILAESGLSEFGISDHLDFRLT